MPGLVQDTMPNFRNAIRIGADVIRSNVAITGDNKIVMYSNDLFNHGTILKPGIASFTADDLRARYREILRGRAASDSTEDIEGVFPGLDDVLKEFPDQRFNLHCLDKTRAIMPVLKQALDQNAAQDRVLISSLSGSNTAWTMKMMPGVPVAFSFYGMIIFYGLFKAGVLFARKKFKARVLIIPEMIGASYFANSGLIKQAHDRDIMVYVNPVDTDTLTRKVREAGADGVVTNDIVSVKGTLL